MKMNIKTVVVLCMAILFMTAAGAMAATDLGQHDDGTADPCKDCHNTASGNPTLRGWASTPATAPNSWWAKNVSNLCYTCHQGGQSAHDMSNNAYANSSHGFSMAILPNEPDGVTADPATAASGLPYVTSGNLECTSCHNVHVESNRPFSQRALGIEPLCSTCHPGRQNDGPTPDRGGSNSQAAPTGTDHNYSTHPTLVAIADTTTANLDDAFPNATWNADLMIAPTAVAPGWALGGHLNNADGTSGPMNCQTCHAVHGPAQDTPGVNAYLVIANDTPLSGNPVGSALCLACHMGGERIENVGTQASSGLPDEFLDHPIDDEVGRAFYPTGVAIPTAAPNWQDGAVDDGAQPFTAIGAGTPACSSCHDAHGGMPGTAILRGPSYDGTTENWTFAYDEWCFLCHDATEVIPANHHSVINNMVSGTDGADTTSILSCGDCHGADGTTDMTAHNGFWSWDDDDNNGNASGVQPINGDSNFCQACHLPANPTNFAAGLKSGRVFAAGAISTPSEHGVYRGTVTHATNEIPNSSNLNVIGWNTTAATTGFDTWRNSATEAATTVNPGRLSEKGATDELRCESCHNILYNGIGSAKDLTGGWKANLLMAPYEDDGQGVNNDNDNGTHDYYGDTTYAAAATGDQLCRVCHSKGGTDGPEFVHNPPVHTMPAAYLYNGTQPDGNTGINPYGRAGSQVLTTPIVLTSCPEVSTADRAAGSSISTLAAPGFFSYPADDSLNCDSCHRPHDADNLSVVGGANLILEYSTANPGTDVCVECHDTLLQCSQ